MALTSNPLDRLPSAEDLPVIDQLLLPVGVLLPLLIALALWVRSPPDRRRRGAIALATTWNAVWLLAFNVVAVQVGWWSFGEAGPAVAGVPIVLWFGWAALWGTAASQSPLRPSATLVTLAVLDLTYMPLFGQAVELHSTWLVGEAVLLAGVAWPGLLLSRWTIEREHLKGQVLLQVAMFTAMLLYVIPAVTSSAAGRPLTLDVPTWALGGVLFGLGGASIPALVAVHDFYLNGGTPWPWDSTDRPVRSGPYRYLRSPMQLAAMLVLVWAMFFFGQIEIGAGALVTLLYSRLFSELEQGDLADRFGPAWSNMALPQNRWTPTWEPSVHGAHATVWVNAGCEVCSPVGDFLAARSPVNLTVANAIEHPDSLIRLRYERDDGTVLHGVQALGACLEHLNFGWAMLGWLLRVPVLWRVWQTIGDAVGFGPRPAASAAATPREWAVSASSGAAER